MALDLVWGLLACTSVGPDSFVSALHSLASRFVPKPKIIEAVLERLHRPRPPETEEEITEWTAAKEAACAGNSRGLPFEALQTVVVTAFTWQAVRFHSASMGSFTGIRSSKST